MGNPPPPDAPPPDEQDAVGVDAGFELGPPAASLCGFSLPTIKFKFKLRLPGFPPKFPWPPFLSLGLSCDPPGLAVDAGLPGGGRKSTMPDDPDAGE